MPTYLKSLPKANGVSSTPKMDVPGIVAGVISDIRTEGDDAVRRYSEKFDKWTPSSFKLSDAEIQEIISRVPNQTIEENSGLCGNITGAKLVISLA